MAVVTPPEITPTPLPAPQRGERDTFKGRVDAFITWLTISVVQFAAVAQNVYANALDAFASAGAAAGYRDTALTYRDAAQAARDKTQEYRDTALQHRNDAQAARDAAQNYAGALVATSATSQTVGAGPKTFVTQAGKQFTVGQVLYFADPANVDRWMAGPVTTYSGTSLSVNITDASAASSGQTSTSWNISIAGVKGAPGAAGGISGGSLTGAINELLAAAVPSAATVDIWSPVGNIVPITGTAAITNFSAAPQAGARRTIRALGAFSITSNANITVFGGTRAVSVGDEIDVLALTTTTFRADVRKADGGSTSSNGKIVEVTLTTGVAWTVPVSDFLVELVGGGQGGQIQGNSETVGQGRGGRSAGYVRKRITGATPGASATISVGTGGLGGNPNVGAPGANGGNTTFVLSGVANLAGNGDGTASGGDLNMAGQDGAPGPLYRGGVQSETWGGHGGSNPMGVGGRGGNPSVPSVSGLDGAGYGSGGGGCGLKNGVQAFGGNGAPGAIRITYVQ